jgi:hypothetical protein
MHPLLSFYVGLDRMARFEREAAHHRQAKTASAHERRSVRTAIQLRASACREELERLALLSERPLHEGDWIVADVDGVAVAAVSVEDGTTVYDPFRPTSQALSLLKLRRKQVLAAAY